MGQVPWLGRLWAEVYQQLVLQGKPMEEATERIINSSISEI
jgi:hypothetical protein